MLIFLSKWRTKATSQNSFMNTQIAELDIQIKSVKDIIFQFLSFPKLTEEETDYLRNLEIKKTDLESEKNLIQLEIKKAKYFKDFLQEIEMAKLDFRQNENTSYLHLKNKIGYITITREAKDYFQQESENEIRDILLYILKTCYGRI
jgi:hypothetical protein